MNGPDQAWSAPRDDTATSSNPHLAPLGRRLGARLIDFAFTNSGFWAIWTGLAVLPAFEITPNDETTMWLLAAAFGTWLLAHTGNLVLVSLRGQSVGKWAAGLVIVDHDGETVGFHRGVLLRELPWWGIVIAMFCGNMLTFGILSIFFPLYPLLMGAVVAPILSSDRRGVHDWMAKTDVVTVNR